MDRDLWPSQFNQNDADFIIGLASNTTGNVLIDEVLTIPMFRFDGSYYLIIGGEVKFRLDDEFTWTDLIVTDSKVQKWLWIAFGRYLPHAAAPTLTDP